MGMLHPSRGPLPALAGPWRQGGHAALLLLLLLHAGDDGSQQGRQSSSRWQDLELVEGLLPAGSGAAPGAPFQRSCLSRAPSTCVLRPHAVWCDGARMHALTVPLFCGAPHGSSVR